MEEERWKDHFIQGTIAPKLTTVQQQKLCQQGIYLVVDTKVADNLFITQLMHDTLTLKQQADIHQKEGEILITHNPDDYEAARMNLDTQWLEEQIRLWNERQENLPLRVFEEVPQTLQRMQRHIREETNVAVATSKELVEEPEREEEMDIEEEEEDTELEEGASIRVMLNVMGEDSPHAQMPKQRKLANVEGYRRISVTREEETATAEVEPSTSKKNKATGKNLAAMRQQMAEETGCKQSELGTPKGFKESLYGQEKGSTHVWGGKGKGKAGQKCKQVSTKKAKKLIPDETGREGWQDPKVLRALRGEAPSGVHKALDDICKRK